jgi:hypothetical protein
MIYSIVLFLLFYVFFSRKSTKLLTTKIISRLGIAIIPCCVALSVGIPILLLTSTGKVQTVVYFINNAFSRRFTHIEHAFLNYPVTLTGGVFDFSEMETAFGFAVIDNGYIRLLYSFGIIGLTLFCVISVFCIWKLTKKKEYIYVVICIISAIQGLLENIYIYIGFNMLIIFWCELTSDKSKLHKMEKQTHDTKKNTLYLARKERNEQHVLNVH